MRFPFVEVTGRCRCTAGLSRAAGRPVLDTSTTMYGRPCENLARNPARQVTVVLSGSVPAWEGGARHAGVPVTGHARGAGRGAAGGPGACAAAVCSRGPAARRRSSGVGRPAATPGVGRPCAPPGAGDALRLPVPPAPRAGAARRPAGPPARRLRDRPRRGRGGPAPLPGPGGPGPTSGCGRAGGGTGAGGAGAVAGLRVRRDRHPLVQRAAPAPRRRAVRRPNGVGRGPVTDGTA